MNSLPRNAGAAIRWGIMARIICDRFGYRGGGLVVVNIDWGVLYSIAMTRHAPRINLPKN